MLPTWYVAPSNSHLGTYPKMDGQVAFSPPAHEFRARELKKGALLASVETILREIAISPSR
jgi:hypothetical protein